MLIFWIFLILSVLSYSYFKIAERYNIIDKPNSRSSHINNTVRGGGIIFVFAVLLYSLQFNFSYPLFTSGVLLIATVSFLDDIRTLSAKSRFPFQFLAITLLLFDSISVISFEPLYILLFFLGIGYINMFNFMDGINGITGLYAISILSLYYLVNIEEQLLATELITYLLISVFIFGFYNFRKKALMFAGDVGSITIGMSIFFIGVHYFLELCAPIFLLSIVVYGADTSMTLLFRMLFTKESIFEAHRHHLYQKVVDNLGWSHLSVSVLYALIQFVINLLVWRSYKLQMEKQLVILLAVVVFFIIIYLALFHNFKKIEKSSI